MNHYAKWLVSVFLMGFISVTALAAGGGGNTEGAPFPVPLSCYSEDAGSEEFLKARCDKIEASKITVIRKVQGLVASYPQD